MSALLLVLGAATLMLAFLAYRYYRDAAELRGRCSQLLQQSEQASTEAREVRTRYSGISNIEAAIAAAQAKLEKAQQDLQQFESESKGQRNSLGREYASALATYNELKKEVSLLEENLEDMSFGVYEPHFSFQTPADYKAALEKLRDDERQLIHDGKAATCPTRWTVGGSEKEGARMVKLNEKVLLRAFNGECDAALANVSWNNITKMEERIKKSFEAVNKLGDVVKVSITHQYLELQLNELRLSHEYETKRYQEREEQRRVREQMREEEKAQKEIEEARITAEADEVTYQRALEKARKEAAEATGVKLEKLTQQVALFETKLDEARQKKEKAKSRAESGFKSGFVYVISNIGSFGEGVYKIGMTRRLDPDERIAELGGASVPFPFDRHAVLWSDNAPELESALHHLFEQRRLNMVNARREFYGEVKLEEIEQFVKQKGLSAQFVEKAEAREYRETLAKREQAAVKETPQSKDKFSHRLFPPVLPGSGAAQA
jgi:hypothetical protein